MSIKMERIWEGESEYDDHPEIEPIYDVGSEEYFKLIPDDEIPRMRVGYSKFVIDEIIARLNSLKGMLDIFNDNGIVIINTNLDRVNDLIIHVSLENYK